MPRRLRIQRECSGELIPASRPQHLLTLREIRDPDGELIYHPDIPDLKDWKAKRWAERTFRRRKMWGRICGVWFLVWFAYLWNNNERAKTPEESIALDTKVRHVLWIATGPLAVRGLWHRIQSGQ